MMTMTTKRKKRKTKKSKKPKNSENTEQQSAEVLNTIAQALNLDSTDIEELGLVSKKNRDKEGREVVLDVAMLENPLGGDGEKARGEDGIKENGDENTNNSDENAELEQHANYHEEGNDNNDDDSNKADDDNADEIGEKNTGKTTTTFDHVAKAEEYSFDFTSSDALSR